MRRRWWQGSSVTAEFELWEVQDHRFGALLGLEFSIVETTKAQRVGACVFLPTVDTVKTTSFSLFHA